MRKKNLPTLLLISGLLFSCSNLGNEEENSAEYKNPLNNYEEILVKKSVLENFLNLSSVQTTTKISQDDEKLYANSTSRGYSKIEGSSTTTSAIYSNKIIVSETISSSAKTSSGIVVRDSYEEKSMTAALENPSELIDNETLTTKYGLYKKNFYKASSGKEFGVTYELLDGNFANDDNVQYKWNNYLLSTFDTISSTSYDFFRDDAGSVEALYSTSSKDVVTNPIYRFDSSKSVTAINSSVSSLTFNNVNNGYELKSLSTVKDTDYLSDYFGNALKDGNVSHSELTASYFYNQTVFPGVAFSSQEYWDLDSSTPVLETYNDSFLQQSVNFKNITRDYQQTYGTDSYAFELTLTPKYSDYKYFLTNKEKMINVDPKTFELSQSVNIQINDDFSFSFLQTNVAYRFLVVMDSSLKTSSISLSLA